MTMNPRGGNCKGKPPMDQKQMIRRIQNLEAQLERAADLIKESQTALDCLVWQRNTLMESIMDHSENLQHPTMVDHRLYVVHDSIRQHMDKHAQAERQERQERRRK